MQAIFIGSLGTALILYIYNDLGKKATSLREEYANIKNVVKEEKEKIKENLEEAQKSVKSYMNWQTGLSLTGLLFQAGSLYMSLPRKKKFSEYISLHRDF